MNTKSIVCSAAISFLFVGCSAMPTIDSQGADRTGDVALKFYPDPRNTLTTAGDQITFEITPRSNAESFTIHFGDGNSRKITSGQISCPTEKSCSPVYVTHAYQVGQAYYPYTVASDGVARNKTKILIARKEMKTNKEIEALAIDSFSSQLVSSLDGFCQQYACSNGRSKFAITMLRNANFNVKGEYDEKLMTVVKNLTRKMIVSDYDVLEKNPQALTRLAHEAVTEKDRPNQYLDKLDYSLQTQSGGPSAPIVYNIRIEGINDVVEERKNTATQNDKSSVNSEGIIEKAKSLIAGSNATPVQVNRTTKQDEAERASKTFDELVKMKKVRPVLLARFKTANYLLVLDEIEKLKSVVQPGSYYSNVYDTPVSKRSASLKVNVRILNREGEIVWINDIKGKYTDQLASGNSDIETVIPDAGLYAKKLANEQVISDKPTANNVVSKAGNIVTGTLDSIINAFSSN